MENINEIYCDLGECLFKVLEANTYKGFNYRIITSGRYPCCYIEIPENHPYFGLSISGDNNNAVTNIKCHGGITFANKTTAFYKDKEIYAIGWDYGHGGDYINDISYMSIICKKYDWRDIKKYTINELIKDIKDVIDQIVDNEKEELS